MNLQDLKYLLLTKFNMEEKDIEMKSDTKLSIKNILECYYDKDNNHFYGYLFYKRQNKLFTKMFCFLTSQAPSLLLYIDKLNNNLKLNEKDYEDYNKNCTKCFNFTIESFYPVCNKYGSKRPLNECKYNCKEWKEDPREAFIKVMKGE